jgi:hypothetical protein
MIQRVSDYERRDRDLYETPEWVTKAIIPFIPANAKIWEPACASGQMAKALNATYASDLVTNYGVPGVDFLKTGLPEGITAIITNPPYNREGEKFIRHGIELLKDVPKSFMAMLLPIDFDSGKTRRDMFADCDMFAGKIVLTSRIIWFEAEGASPTTNHAWYFWNRDHIGFARYFYHFKDEKQ